MATCAGQTIIETLVGPNVSVHSITSLGAAVEYGYGLYLEPVLVTEIWPDIGYKAGFVTSVNIDGDEWIDVIRNANRFDPFGQLPASLQRLGVSCTDVVYLVPAYSNVDNIPRNRECIVESYNILMRAGGVSALKF